MTESTVAEGANVFYVYLLLKTPMVEPPVLGTFDLDQVLYAGKGKGYRWHSHFQEALQGSEGEKADAIRAALGDTPSPEEIEPPRVPCSLDSVAFGSRGRRLPSWHVRRSTHRSCVVERSLR